MTRLELKNIIACYGFSYRKIAEYTGERLNFTYISELVNGNKLLTAELTNRIMAAIYKADSERTKGAI